MLEEREFKKGQFTERDTAGEFMENQDQFALVEKLEVTLEENAKLKEEIGDLKEENATLWKQVDSLKDKVEELYESRSFWMDQLVR